MNWMPNRASVWRVRRHVLRRLDAPVVDGETGNWRTDGNWVRFAQRQPCCAYLSLQRFRFVDFRRRRPGPPPFSSMNSIPAACSAFSIFSAVSLRPPSRPSFNSKRLIVGTETSAARARLSCDQPRSARAALIWRIETFSIDLFIMAMDTFGISSLVGR